jgi:protein TonB
MAALAMPGPTERHDVLRWSLCFAVVAAAHTAAVLVLLYASQSSDADFMAGAAVEVIDLPQTPAAMPMPLTELPPGPPEDEQVNTNPPPKEETKPPEQTAEVALPEPEPPKIEPPPEEAKAPPPSPLQDEARATTAGVELAEPKPPSAALLRWQSGLQAQIARKKDYPARARARHEEGFVRIAFTIDRNGHVLSSRILESSGSSDLDEELLSMVNRAQPLPKPPPDAKDTDLEIKVGMRFSLK